MEYVLFSCDNRFNTAVHRASRYFVKSINGFCALQLPDAILQNDIPNSIEGIPSSEEAQ